LHGESLFDKNLTAVATHAHYHHVGGFHEFDDRVIHRTEAAKAAAGNPASLYGAPSSMPAMIRVSTARACGSYATRISPSTPEPPRPSADCGGGQSADAVDDLSIHTGSGPRNLAVSGGFCDHPSAFLHEAQQKSSQSAQLLDMAASPSDRAV
jgi:hypothetical protein